MSLALAPSAPSPIDGARAYQLRAEGCTWTAIGGTLGCTADQAKHAAARYADARSAYVFG
jgi:hypothetical protein